MWKNISKIMGAIGIILTIAGITLASNSYFTPTSKFCELEERVEVVKARVEKNYIQDDIRFIRNMMREIEIRYGTDVSKMPSNEKANYMNLQEQLNNSLKKLEEFNK